MAPNLKKKKNESENRNVGCLELWVWKSVAYCKLLKEGLSITVGLKWVWRVWRFSESKWDCEGFREKGFVGGFKRGQGRDMEGFLGKERSSDGREIGERLELDEKMKRRSHFLEVLCHFPATDICYFLVVGSFYWFFLFLLFLFFFFSFKWINNYDYNFFFWKRKINHKDYKLWDIFQQD